MTYLSSAAEELINSKKEDIVHFYEHVYYSDCDRYGPQSADHTLFLILKGCDEFIYQTYQMDVWHGTPEPYMQIVEFSSPVLFKPPVDYPSYHLDDEYDYTDERIYLLHRKLSTIVKHIETCGSGDLKKIPGLTSKIIEGSTIIC